MNNHHSNHKSLTEREGEILLDMVLGLANKQIAHNRGCSIQTIKNHAYSIFRKLDVRSRTEAATYAVKRGTLVLR